MHNGDKLPEHLRSTYQSYKSATDYCTTWLVDTASTIGFDVSQFFVTSVKKRPGAPRPIVLQTRHFLDLAKAIVAADKAVEEPDKVLRKLGLALRARRLCAAWFRGCDRATQTKEQNDRHSHFIMILEQVLELLRPLLIRRCSKDKAACHSASISDEHEDQCHTNLYDNLAVQTEQLQVDDLTEATPPSAGSGKSVAGYEIKIEDLDDCNAHNAFLAAYCLLTDLHRLRAQVRQTWADYKAGSCSSAFAALTTNTTIELVEALELEFYDSTSTDQSYQMTILNQFMDYGIQHMEDLQVSQDPIVNDFQYFLEDPKRFIFHDPWYLAIGFMYEVTRNLAAEEDAERQRSEYRKDAKKTKRAAKKEGVPSMIPARATQTSYPTSLSPASDVVNRPVIMRGHNFEVTFADIARHTNKQHLAWLHAAYDLSLDSASSNPHPWSAIEDQTLLKLREVQQTSTVELSTCFAVQAFCDIREILENSTERPLADLDVAAREVRVKAALFEIKHCKRSNIDLSRPRHGATHVDAGRGWQLEAANLANIILDNKSRTPDPAAGFYARSDVRAIIANSPVAVGLYHFQLTITLARGVCTEVDNTGITTGMLYFYETIGNMGFMEKLWPDLEYLIGFHTPEHLFFGGRPLNAGEAYRKLSLAFGYTFTGKRIMSAGIASGNQRTFWAKAFSICKLLWPHTLACRNKRPFRHLEQLQLILSELDKRGTKHRIKMNHCGMFEDGCFADLKRWSRDDAKLTPTELIARYGKHLKQELKHHRFDYSALENHITSVMKQARLQCESENMVMAPPVTLNSGITIVWPFPPEALNQYVEGQMLRAQTAMVEGVPGLEACVASEVEGVR